VALHTSTIQYWEYIAAHMFPLYKTVNYVPTETQVTYNLIDPTLITTLISPTQCKRTLNFHSVHLLCRE